MKHTDPLLMECGIVGQGPRLLGVEYFRICGVTSARGNEWEVRCGHPLAALHGIARVPFPCDGATVWGQEVALQGRSEDGKRQKKTAVLPRNRGCFWEKEGRFHHYPLGFWPPPPAFQNTSRRRPAEDSLSFFGASAIGVSGGI